MDGEHGRVLHRLLHRLRRVDPEQVTGVEGPHHSHARGSDADVQKVDESRAFETRRDLGGVVGSEPGPIARLLVADEAEPDRDVVADRRAHGLEHLHAETHAVLESAAVAVRATVALG